jgi:hypothetical protein
VPIGHRQSVIRRPVAQKLSLNATRRRPRQGVQASFLSNVDGRVALNVFPPPFLQERLVSIRGKSGIVYTGKQWPDGAMASHMVRGREILETHPSRVRCVLTDGMEFLAPGGQFVTMNWAFVQFVDDCMYCAVILLTSAAYAVPHWLAVELCCLNKLIRKAVPGRRRQTTFRIWTTPCHTPPFVD